MTCIKHVNRRLLLFSAVVMACCALPPMVHADPPKNATTQPAAPKLVTFKTSDGGEIAANVFGSGERGVVLAHGGRFNKESWNAQARELTDAGFHVLAFDFRGYGDSKGGSASTDRDRGFPLDVLAAVRYLREHGATSVAVVGGSFGGWATAMACVAAKPGEIDRIVLLAHSSIPNPETLKGRKLFIVARDDLFANGTARLEKIKEQFEKAPEPKVLVVLEGSAHAQHIFDTDQGERLMAEILKFLNAP